jgi:hypothetical protein
MATLLQDEIANGKDRKLVAYAKATLPVVQEHLSMAQSDAKGSTSSSTSGSMMKSSSSTMKSSTMKSSAGAIKNASPMPMST